MAFGKTAQIVRSVQLLNIVQFTVQFSWICHGTDGPEVTMQPVIEYLKHKPGLRDRILDRGELKRVARACGLSPQDARSELKKLGFTLTKNDHGLTIWMR